MKEREEWTDHNGRKFTLWQIQICLCCMLSQANGECCAEEGNESHGLPQGWPEGTTLTLGRLDHESVCGAECEGGCQDAGFSWSGCEWCKSGLGGDRYYAVAWEPVL